MTLTPDPIDQLRRWAGDNLLEAITDEEMSADDRIVDLQLLAFDDEEVGSRLSSFCFDDGLVDDDTIAAVMEAAARAIPGDDPVHDENEGFGYPNPRAEHWNGVS